MVNHSLESELTRAIDRQELRLHYQPQVDARTGRVAAVEALLRWAHPERGLIPPNVFIPLAEQSLLIIAIGDWVLRTACLQSQAWRQAGLTPVRMAVNLSPRQFADPQLVDRIEAALDDARLEPFDLELEITESLVAENPDAAAKIVARLRKSGVRLMIDDFGTGYSSLASLKRFPVDGLKIDRAFVRDLPYDRHDVSITKAVIALARELELDVVAEGVETREQRAFLAVLGCGLIQGYLTGAPQPPENLRGLLSAPRLEAKT